jgi:hypothetical protein
MDPARQRARAVVPSNRQQLTPSNEQIGETTCNAYSIGVLRQSPVANLGEGFNTPSKVNEAAFRDAVEEAFEVARRLIDRLETTASPRNRDEKAEKARQRATERFGRRASA